MRNQIMVHSSFSGTMRQTLVLAAFVVVAVLASNAAAAEENQEEKQCKFMSLHSVNM